MKQINILKGLLIMFAMMMTVQVAKASDELSVWTGMIGKTSFYDFNKMLGEKGFHMFESIENEARYKGTENDDSVKITLMFNNRYVKGLFYLKQTSSKIVKQEYEQIVSSLEENYPNLAYGYKTEGNKILSFFTSDDRGICVTLETIGKNYELAYYYELNDEYSEDAEEPDDTFEPDSTIEEDGSLRAKDIEDGNWSVSDEFITKPGNKGSYWFPTMRVLCCADGKYMLTIIRPAYNGYFKLSEGDDCYIRLDNDSIVTLKLNTEYSPWNYEREGYYQNGVFMKKKYITQTFYDIENVWQLSNNNIIKIRWIEDNKPYDIDYKENKWAKNFNKSFHDAILQANKKEYERSSVTDDNLIGF